jgi:hypothetical protein
MIYTPANTLYSIDLPCKLQIEHQHSFSQLAGEATQHKVRDTCAGHFQVSSQFTSNSQSFPKAQFPLVDSHGSLAYSNISLQYDFK